MQQSLKRYDRNLEVVLDTYTPLPTVQIEITSGRARNRIRDVQGSYFIGSDLDCDLVLRDDRFPPLYAFLLVRPHGIILRSFGHGPELIVDGRATRRALISDTACICTGPFSLTVRVSLSRSTPPFDVRIHNFQVQAPDKCRPELLQRASRLLSDIRRSVSRQDALPNVYAMPAQATKAPPVSAPASTRNVSFGVPPSDCTPPTWKHRTL